MTNPTAEQARKEERDAIVDWILHHAMKWEGDAIQNEFSRLNGSIGRTIAEAIQRGDHREQQ